jgi:DNA helicase-2/ATP-dependent DNA helicase PcrA
MYDLKELHSKLTDEQLLTFDKDAQYKCILASAGSGKTRTLVHQIIDDLNNGISPENIVAFTFTNKAADELLNRIKIMARINTPDIDLNGIYIGTIHSWCFDFISKNKNYINFSTLDELHQYSLISRLYDDIKINELYNTNFPKGIKEFIKDLDVFYNENLQINDLPEKLKKPISIYQKTLYDNRLIDFGSLISAAIEELIRSKKHPNIISLYVDEYQDVNPAQVTLIKTMLNDKTKLTVVGDELQCIYNWRGSDVMRIIEFKRDFPYKSKIFRLNYNFRSTKSIVNIANAFSERINIRDKTKKMIVKRKDNDYKMLLVSTRDEVDQAIQVQRIVSQFLQAGHKINDIAILFRSIKSSSEEIIEALNNAAIPVNCSLVGRGVNFVFNFILPLFEWIAIPIEDPKNEEEEKEIEERGNLLWNIAKEFISDPTFKESLFWNAVNIWKSEISNATNNSYNIRKLLYDFINNININIKADSNDLIVSLGIISQIIRSNEEIHRRRLVSKDRKSVKQIYRECIDSIRHNYFDFGESIPVNYSSNGILVTTVHQSKGLEFPIVIMPMIDRNRFPLRKSSHGTSFPDEVALRYGTSREDERRLFYVSITRAKERLILLDTAASSITDSSLFIQDIINDSNTDVLTEIPLKTDLFWNYKIESGKSDEIVHIGLSDLLIYMDCSFQFALRRKSNIQPQIGDELGYGKGLHEVIQRIFLNKSEGLNEELSSMVESYIHIPYQSSENEKSSKISIFDRIKFLETLGLFNLEILPEEKFELISENFIIDGIIDGISKNDDGTVSIYDWKSNIHSQFIERYKLQILIYALGLKKKGYTVKNAILIDVGESFKKGTLIKMEINLDEKDFANIDDTLKSNLKSLSESKFDPTPTIRSCSSCDMSKICSYKIII